MHCSKRVFLHWLAVPANLFLAALLAVAALRVLLPNAAHERLQELAGQEVVVQGKLYDDPDQTTDNLYKVRIKTADGANIFATFPVREIKDMTLERGDTVTLRGKLKSGFGAFSGSIYRGEVVDYSKSNPPDRFLQIRNWFSGLIEKHIPAPESSLALGYLLGQKRALPAALLGMLAVTGLTHIVVASGANLTIITRMMRRLFRRSRRAAFLAAALVIGMMMAIIGFAPSLVRAGMVAGLALIAWYLGRPVHPIRLILLAAATTIVINPTFILDIGWQLSFAAFAGVMLLAPVLTKFFYGDPADGGKEPRALPKIAIETIAATIVTLPILLYNFGYISLISLVPNLLILPTIPLTMLLGFLTGVFAIFAAPIAAILGWVATLILKYHILVINFFGELDFAVVEISFSMVQALILYAVVLVAWLAMLRGTRHRLLATNIVE
jgi:competence protein ComEC